MKTWTRARELAELTPPDRNRYVDFLRAVSILVVVFGHWLMAAPQVLPDGTLRAGHLLSEVPWTQALTWMFQIMPVFFFVGGYSNARGWRAAARDGIAYSAWLRDRLRRLLLPVAALLATWIVIAAAALDFGVDGDLLRLGSQAALVPVWFLASYVLIVATVPLTLRGWERLGWTAFFGLAVAAASIDLLTLGFGVPHVMWLNYLFVWNAVHMLGYAWADGRTGGRSSRAGTAFAGLASLAVLVAAFPYPLAMVGLDGAAVTNSNPPKATLIALGLFQFGLALLAEPAANRWLSRTRPWTATVAVNGSIMTLYLWHLTAMVGVLAASLSLGGFGLHARPGSGSWWASRPLWLALMTLATLPFLGLLAPIERPRPDGRPAPRVWRPLLAVAASCCGLGLLARFGIANGDGLNGLALGLAFSGLLLGGLLAPGPQSARSRAR